MQRIQNGEARKAIIPKPIAKKKKKSKWGSDLGLDTKGLSERW